MVPAASLVTRSGCGCRQAVCSRDGLQVPFEPAKEAPIALIAHVVLARAHPW